MELMAPLKACETGVGEKRPPGRRSCAVVVVVIMGIVEDDEVEEEEEGDVVDASGAGLGNGEEVDGEGWRARRAVRRRWWRW